MLITTIPLPCCYDTVFYDYGKAYSDTGTTMKKKDDYEGGTEKKAKFEKWSGIDDRRRRRNEEEWGH